jgi:hypothetical protein
VFEWLDQVPLWAIGIGLVLLMAFALIAGHRLYLLTDRPSRSKSQASTDFSGYVVTAMLGLVAIVMAFTFSLATERFEERRQIVIDQANAIGTAYLRVQLFDSPYRERLSGLIRGYVDEQIRLADSGYPKSGPLREQNSRLLDEIWQATAAMFSSAKTAPFSGWLVDSINKVIDLDAARSFARLTRLPVEIFVVLCVIMISVAGVLGYEIGIERGLFLAGFVMGLMVVAFLLILDLDRPQSGGIREVQWPMEELQKSLSESRNAPDPGVTVSYGHIR